MSEYIEREKAIAFAHNAMWGKPKECEKLEEVLRMMPAEDVAPVVHGRWESVYQEGACSWTGRCSICGVRNDIPHPLVAHYCPNCGAKMDGEE